MEKPDIMRVDDRRLSQRDLAPLDAPAEHNWMPANKRGSD
jgi:hypothetical protein